MLSWTRPEGEIYLTFWFQVSQHGWDRYAGSQFIVELQLSSQPVVGTGLRRSRLPTLLSESEREELRQRQNTVIGRLQSPPSAYVEMLSAGSLDTKSWYLNHFEAVNQPYYEGQDIWFRYASEDDVQAWCEFIKAKLPPAIDKFVAGS